MHTPSSPLQHCYTPNDQEPASPDYFNHKHRSLDPKHPSPIASPAASLRTTRRVKTNDGIAQSQADRRVLNKKDGRRQARVFDEEWKSHDRKVDGEKEEKGCAWPEDYGAYGLDLLFEPDTLRSRNTSPAFVRIQQDSPGITASSTPVAMGHTSRSKSGSRLRKELLPNGEANDEHIVKNTHKRSTSSSKLKDRMLLNSKLRLEMPPPRSPSSFTQCMSRRRDWEGVGTNEPVTMEDVRRMRLKRNSHRTMPQEAGAIRTAGDTCHSPASYATTTKSTHPALLSPPSVPTETRQHLQHAIKHNILHSQSDSDAALPALWAQLRAGITLKSIANAADDDIRRQISMCRGLSGAELEDAVKERGADLDNMRKWIGKCREKGG
jgi:hypothetical protein